MFRRSGGTRRRREEHRSPTRISPAVRLEEARHQPQRGRLAAAGWAEQADERSLGDVEVDPVDDGAPAVLLGQSCKLEKPHSTSRGRLPWVWHLLRVDRPIRGGVSCGGAAVSIRFHTCGLAFFRTGSDGGGEDRCLSEWARAPRVRRGWRYGGGSETGCQLILALAGGRGSVAAMQAALRAADVGSW